MGPSLFKTAAAAWGASLLTSLAPLVHADNPIVQTRYTADPAPLVHDGRVYLFTSHDEDTDPDFFDMRDWRLYSTDDMMNWLDHGSPLGYESFSWASSDAWAGQVVRRGDRFYWYVPVNDQDGVKAIGVAVADEITGPWEDALGSPLITNGEIDPHAFIDDDGQAYLYWGNPNLWYARLNEDMVSIQGEPVQVNLTVEGFGPRRDEESDRPTAYEEGPWLYKRGDTYYLVYAANCCDEDIRYSTAPSATGPWTYRGLVMESAGGSFTNHPGMLEYMGNTYFFYHNGALPRGGGYARSVAVEQFLYNADGSIPTMVMTETGAPQIRTVDPYQRHEAEFIAWSRGLTTEACEDEDGGGGMMVTGIHDSDYIKVGGVDFGTDGAASFSARVASGGEGGRIELRLENWERGAVVGECQVPGTGGAQDWTTLSCPVNGTAGTHDLWFAFYSTSDEEDDESEDEEGLFNFNWWQFE